MTDWGDESEGSRYDPVYHLYLLLAGGWTLDPEWVSKPDGTWQDDSGEILPADVPHQLTPAEHLAAHGLWLVRGEFSSVGSIPSEPMGEQGWTREEVLQHRSTCIALAYQALAFAQKMLLGDELSRDEIAKAVRAATARKAADALHDQPGGSREKRETIRTAWLSGKYRSRDICAEQECAALDMSFSTARKALIGTPEPLSRSK